MKPYKRSFSFTGVLLVTLSDGSAAVPSPLSSHMPDELRSESFDSRKRPAWGNFLAIMSAVFYALYVTLLKVKIRDESRINMQMFFGFVGLFNILMLWPVGVALHVLDIERFELPSSSSVWAAVLTNVRCCWAHAFCL